MKSFSMYELSMDSFDETRQMAVELAAKKKAEQQRLQQERAPSESSTGTKARRGFFGFGSKKDKKGEQGNKRGITFRSEAVAASTKAMTGVVGNSGANGSKKNLMENHTQSTTHSKQTLKQRGTASSPPENMMTHANDHDHGLDSLGAVVNAAPPPPLFTQTLAVDRMWTSLKESIEEGKRLETIGTFVTMQMMKLDDTCRAKMKITALQGERHVAVSKITANIVQKSIALLKENADESTLKERFKSMAKDAYKNGIPMTVLSPAVCVALKQELVTSLTLQEEDSWKTVLDYTSYKIQRYVMKYIAKEEDKAQG